MEGVIIYFCVKQQLQLQKLNLQKKKKSAFLPILLLRKLTFEFSEKDLRSFSVLKDNQIKYVYYSFLKNICRG